MKKQTKEEFQEKIKIRDVEIEKLRTQLAGCSVVAIGGTSEKELAKAGDYGWSPAYQDVLELRLEYDKIKPKESI